MTAPASEQGRSGTGTISRFDARKFEVHDDVEQKTARRMDRCSHLVVAAARQAEADARLDGAAVAERAGRCSCSRGSSTLVAAALASTQSSPDTASPPTPTTSPTRTRVLLPPRWGMSQHGPSPNPIEGRLSFPTARVRPGS